MHTLRASLRPLPMVRIRFLPIEESPLISWMLASTRSSSPDICHFHWHCCKQMFKRGQCTGKVIQGWLWAVRSTEKCAEFLEKSGALCLSRMVAVSSPHWILPPWDFCTYDWNVLMSTTYIYISLRLAYKTCCCGHVKSSNIPWSFF